MRIRAPASVLLVLSTLAACATSPHAGRSAAPEVRADRALRALHAEAFESAREELFGLAADCSAGVHGRRALLLLAASELDTANPYRSPRRAAHLAAAYLLLPDASPEAIPLARTLYRLGTDLAAPGSPGGEEEPMPAVAHRFDSCAVTAAGSDPGPLPTTPSAASIHLTALRAELAASIDSVARLRADLAARSSEIAALRAEIERITELLKSGTPRYTRQDRR